jgi:hypothetical protein
MEIEGGGVDDRFWPGAAGWGSMTEDSPFRTGADPKPPLSSGRFRLGYSDCVLTILAHQELQCASPFAQMN